MSKVAVVMAREFRSTVRRKSYLIVTFGMPFFAALYFGMVGLLPAYFMAQSGKSRKEAGVVDLAGVIRWEEAGAAGKVLEEAQNLVEKVARGRSPEIKGNRVAQAILEKVAAPVRFRSIATRKEAIEALRAGTIDRFYVIPADYLATGAVETYQGSDVGLGIGRSKSNRALARFLSRSLMSGRLADDLLRRVEDPIEADAAKTFVLGEGGAIEPLDTGERIARLAIPGVFGILLLMSLMTSAGYLLQGVSEEKENRVIEVILSSVRPQELLFGKLLGLGGAGLLQLFVWVAVTSLATSLVAAAALAVLDIRLFASCLVFFILGYLLIGGLMTGTGALGTNARETQQLAAVWSIATVLPPALTWMSILDDPNGWVARGLGWFPLSAPITMMMRMATGKVPLWDVLLAVAILAASVYLALRLTARLFRLGLLLYGKRPTLREIARQLRHA
jgi:ABC-2 type transport system permease protein